MELYFANKLSAMLTGDFELSTINYQLSIKEFLFRNTLLLLSKREMSSCTRFLFFSKEKMSSGTLGYF